MPANKPKAETAKKVEGEVEASVEAKAQLVVAEASENAVALFTDAKQYSDFHARLKAAVSTHVPDVSTDKGRREIAAVAFRVTKAKTTLDKAGLALTEGWRTSIKEVNAARFKMVEELDELAAEVRKPLTEWEKAEETRVALVEAALANFRNAATVEEEETAAMVEERGRALADQELDADLLRDRLEEAQGAKDAAVLALLKARDRLRQEEADRLELERLRQAAAEREEADRVAAERKQAEEAEAARKAEEARIAAEAEAARVAEIAAAEERASQAAREEERRALAAQEEERERARIAETEERERAHQAELEEQRRAAAAAEEDARKVREAEEARQREADRVAEEERVRARDKAHRKEVLDAAALDIAEAIGKNLPKTALAAASERVALAIAAGSVRHVSVQF